MLYRSSTLRHPSGVAIKTPLLVPSFSSKGFGFGRTGQSEIRDIFKNTAELLTETMLVSAYDIFYGHLPKPDRFVCTPSITFVDSGGYEASTHYDFSAIYKYAHLVQKWDLRRFKNILDSWPDRIPAVFVSFDKATAGQSVAAQIREARSLFRRYPRHLHNFLLKPSKGSRGLLINTIKAAQPILKDLAPFHVIGVTEKELGDSMLDRMEALATLRSSLDSAGVSSPIQVFGALDPLSSSLYLLAGAEIFDGLTWLRFAYCEGQLLYSHNYGVLRTGLDGKYDFIQSKILSDNYNELRKLQLSFRDFVSTKNFEKLSPYTKVLRDAYDSLINRLG